MQDLDSRVVPSRTPPAAKYFAEFKVQSESDAQANFPNWQDFNHISGIYAECAHLFYRIVPDSLFETHPEYFALIDGKRKAGRHEVQRCLSHDLNLDTDNVILTAPR